MEVDERRKKIRRLVAYHERMTSADPQTTRMELLYAAALEISERGYSGASFSSVGARLGLTKGAFAYHFPTKRALAVGIMEHFGEAFTNAIVDAREDFPDDDIRTALRAMRTIEVRADTEPLVGAAFTLMGDPQPPVEEIQEKFGWWVNTFMHFLANAESSEQVVLTVPLDEAAEFLVISLLSLTNLSHRALARSRIKDQMYLRFLLTAIGAADPGSLLREVVGETQGFPNSLNSYKRPPDISG